jgi:3-isopropylmalate dehydrogenase
MTQVRKTIAVLPGDGIGPEVTAAAVSLLGDCASAFGHKFEFCQLPFGGEAIDRCGEPLPKETLAACRASDAVLLGAIGGPKWEAMPLGKRPEAGLLGIRQELGLFINLRPIRVRPALRDICPLRPERLGDTDFEIVRELTGDIYFGDHIYVRRDHAGRDLFVQARRRPQGPSHERRQSQRTCDINSLARHRVRDGL